MNLETLTKMQERRSLYKWEDNKPRRFGDWIVTTDGHGLYAIRSSEECSADTGGLKSALPIIELSLGKTRLPVAEFREALGLSSGKEWCIKCANTGRVDCDGCDGTGDKECSCIECGNDHTYRCDICLGAATFRCTCGHPPVKKDEKEFILINEIPFDKELVRDYVALVQAETYRFAQAESGAIHIGDDDWKLAIMPLRMYDQTKPVTRFEMK